MPSIVFNNKKYTVSNKIKYTTIIIVGICLTAITGNPICGIIIGWGIGGLIDKDNKE